MKRVKKKIYSGCVCEQVVYCTSDRASLKEKKRPRFADEEQYAKFKDAIGRKRNAQLINANFSPRSLKGTLTFDAENEVHTFEEVLPILRAYVRRIQRKCPGAKIYMVKGRGKSTARIHFHYIMDGVPENVIRGKWTWGKVVECEHLRKKCFDKDGNDIGQDYTALANYYWDHWTPEQGGHHYFATRNMEKPEEEKPEEVRREYTYEKPPRAPKGYRLTKREETPFGFLYFKYVKIMS